MIEIAKQKMPDAVLIQHDFSQGLPPELAGETFDYIICTYAIHHLEDAQKVNTLREWMEHLTEGGKYWLEMLHLRRWMKWSAVRCEAGKNGTRMRVILSRKC